MSKFLLVSAVLASSVVGSLSAGFNEDFESFQSHYPAVIKCVEGVRKNADVYPLEKWQSEEDMAIKLYGLFNYMMGRESELSRRRSEFINASGYKNFPDPKEHPPQIVAFSSAMKPFIDEINITARPVSKRIENLYGYIGARDAISLLFAVKSLELDLTILNRIDGMLQNLAQKASEFVYIEPQDVEEIQHPMVSQPLDANPELTAFNAFLASDMLTLKVLNEGKKTI